MPTTYPTTADSFATYREDQPNWDNPPIAKRITDLGDAIDAIERKLGTASAGQTPVVREATFTETAGAGVYTARITVPAGAYLIDVLVHGVAVWDNAGAVDMQVGDAAVGGAEIDQNGFLVITSLKAAGDLLAGETLACGGGAGTAGGEVGADIANNAWSRRYLATARDIVGIITTASTGGSTGRTRMIVVYALPDPDVVAATKV